MIRDGQALKNASWVSDEMVTFKNPAVRDNTAIAAWTCSTHNLKALRNALLNSSENAKLPRSFENMDGIKFGFSTTSAKSMYDKTF